MVRVRDDLVGQSPYGAPQLDVRARLNVNENPFALSAQVSSAMGEAVRAAASDMNRYPDRDAIALRTDLANYLKRESGGQLDASNIWAANGSNEVMHHVLLAYGGPGRTLVTFTPSYSMYSEYCRDTFTNFVTVPRTEEFVVDQNAIDEALRCNPDIIVVCSPNNPTGTVLDFQVLTYLLNSFDGLVVVDEAYGEFRAIGTPSAITLLETHPNLVAMRTMSKAFSCAGLRLGYLAASADIVAGCQLVRLPYHLSAVTQAVARTALAFSEQLLAQVDILRTERDALAIWLEEHGFDVTPSGANFLLFGQFSDRHAVWQGLLDHGVLIRETGPKGWLRVSIGTPQENELFRQALLAIDAKDSR